ncbi:hypothetical protein [Pelagibius sp. Alg239-R121]|uniref:hypothetical protein n=1 Tax=Pelagibius sp. Alg239-R121 TaxID=2993448 RepID=UPI0024A6B9DF|nr:hypothetical protein [Pelagibius sp. Alg239-R121]
MNLYLKAFLAMSIPFAAMTGFIIAGDQGVANGIATGVAAGVAFGALAAIILVTLHNKAIARLPYPEDAKSNAVKQAKSIFVDWDYDTAFTRCAQAISEYGCRQIQPDPLHGTIVSKSKLDIFSALQSIGMRVIELEPGHCEIQIISRPKMPTTLLDYGRNLKNVEELARNLLRYNDPEEEQE